MEVKIERGEVQMISSTIEVAAWSRHTLRHILLGGLALMSLSTALGNQAQAETVQMALSSPPMIWVWQDPHGNLPSSNNPALYNGYGSPEEACVARGMSDGKTTFVTPVKISDTYYICELRNTYWSGSSGAVAYVVYGPRCPDPRHWILYYGNQSCPATKACPSVSSGEPPYIPDPNGQTCSRPDQETYTLALTPNTATIEPNQSYTFTATVTKNEGGAPDKDIPVTVEVKVDVTSGGHDHGEAVAPRPKGTLSTTSGNISFPITFTATDVSGTHTITARCEQCVENTKEAVVTVKVDGLIEIPASQFYVFGSSSRHGTKNHYLMPAAAEKLLLLAINYQSQGQFKVMNPNTNTMVWPEPFRVNDASLEWGGRFDIFGDWTNPHIEHRRGTTVDLRANEGTPNAIPPENFEGFEMLLTNINGGEEGGFIRECTKDKKDTNGNLIPPIHKRMASNYCVSQLDGSFDDNRHYHVRLMGVAE